ncbi:MAG: S4 domain-containing protein, partial [Gaiellaceae bacterium]
MKLVVPPEAAGERLDVFLATAAGSRAAAQKLIDAGLVLVDGAARPKRHTVSAGERVLVQPAPPAEEPE